ncbi:MAG: hypothetical protein NTW86_09170 [Candidatus Sumerlaeota bacterium]|nr:hypothetical protein [Candidatus Sumerlaeota bacterium]
MDPMAAFQVALFLPVAGMGVHLLGCLAGILLGLYWWRKRKDAVYLLLALAFYAFGMGLHDPAQFRASGTAESLARAIGIPFSTAIFLWLSYVELPRRRSVNPQAADSAD